jgi:hypothetical protein
MNRKAMTKTRLLILAWMLCWPLVNVAESALSRMNTQVPLTIVRKKGICGVSSVPWIGLAGTNVYRAVRTNEYGYIHHTSLLNRTNETSGSRTNTGRRFGGRRGGMRADEDHWSVFATERREIADCVRSNHISGVCILHGDSHMLAAEDGSNSDYATGGGAPIPVMCAAPLDQEPSLKRGPYSQGVYRVR